MNVTSAECCYPGCRNAVIGQCQGYSSRCGHFYCRTHSVDSLCYDCAAKRQADYEEALEQQAITRLLDEYTAIASQTPVMSDFKIFFLAALAGLVGWTLVEFLFSSTILGVLLGIVIFIVTLPNIRTWSKTKEEKWLAPLDTSHPGFKDFYLLWQQYKGQEERDVLGQAFVGAVGIVAISAVALSAAALRENAKLDETFRNNQVRDDVNAIRRRLDKM